MRSELSPTALEVLARDLDGDVWQARTQRATPLLRFVDRLLERGGSVGLKLLARDRLIDLGGLDEPRGQVLDDFWQRQATMER